MTTAFLDELTKLAMSIKIQAPKVSTKMPRMKGLNVSTKPAKMAPPGKMSMPVTPTPKVNPRGAEQSAMPPSPVTAS